MSDVLAKIRAKAAEREAAKKAEEEKEAEIKKNVAENKLRLSDTQKKQISEQEQKVLEEEKEQLSAIVSLPETVYEIEGLDPERLVHNLEELQVGLEQGDSRIKSYMKEILQNLKQFPDLAYLLSDDQIGLISRGSLQQANVQIAVTTAKKKSATKKVASKDLDLSSMDLSTLKL